MKLRIARKVLWCAPDCDYVQRHRSGTVLRALARTEKTKSEKDASRYWNRCMDMLGEEGRRELVMRVKIREMIDAMKARGEL